MNVVEECKKMLSHQQRFLNFQQSVVNRKAEEQGHEGVPLLSPFDLVPHSLDVDPCRISRFENRGHAPTPSIESTVVSGLAPLTKLHCVTDAIMLLRRPT